MEQLCYGCMRMKQQSICEHCGFEETTQNAGHQLPVGTVLQNQFVVGKVLGQGGFGITYIGWDKNLKVPIAIKEYFPSGQVSRNATRSCQVECTANPALFQDGRSRFVREAQTLAKLRHQHNIVQVLGFFEENNTAYIVMEYVKGITLQEYIRQRGGKLTPSETFTLARPVLRALHQVHETGMIHRDISPDNIMLQDDDTVKILDFGTARDVNPSGVATHSTQAILKHGFAPLEQYQSRGSLGPWTDEYALCATIYYCLTGAVPTESLSRLTETDTLDWNAIPGLTERQRYALGKGMSVRLEDRYQTLSQLEYDLFGEGPMVKPAQAASETQPASAGSSPNSQAASDKPPKKHRGFLLLILLLAAALVLSAVLLLLDSKEPEPAPTETTASVETESTGPGEYALFMFSNNTTYADALIRAFMDSEDYAKDYSGGTIDLRTVSADWTMDQQTDLLLLDTVTAQSLVDSPLTAELDLEGNASNTTTFANTHGASLQTLKDAEGRNKAISYKGHYWLMAASGTAAPDLTRDFVHFYIQDKSISNMLSGPTTNTETPLYSAPADTNNGPITTLPLDSPVTILRAEVMANNNSWSYVESLDGDQGWCLTDQIQQSGLLGIVTSMINIRNVPSVNAAVVGQYQAGDQIIILRIDEVSGEPWYMTNLGWIVSTFVDVVP